MATETWSDISPSEIDVFGDYVRIAFDWQSSRIRRALNVITVGVTRDRLHIGYSECPRATPVLNGSALLHLASGENEDEPVVGAVDPHIGSVAFVAESGANDNMMAGRMEWRPEPSLLWPAGTNDVMAQGVPGDVHGPNPLAFKWDNGPLSSVINHLSYNETREVLGFLFRVLDEDIVPGAPHLGTFRGYLDAVAAGRIRVAPGTIPTCLWRLRRFAQGVPTLGGRPGRILLRWWHPFELSNAFVGWNFVGEAVASGTPDPPEAYLWPVPYFAGRFEAPDAEEPTVSGWILTEPVSLHSGQHLVGEGVSSVPSHRTPTTRSSEWVGLRGQPAGANVRPKRTRPSAARFSSLVWLPAPRDARPLSVQPVPGGALASEHRDEATAVRARSLIRAAAGPDGPSARDISISELGILVDIGRHMVGRLWDGGAAGPHAPIYEPGLYTILNLDGVTGGRVDHVRLVASQREYAGHTMPTVVVERAAIQLGVHAPTRDVLFRDVIVDVHGRQASLIFGPGARGNTWIGGEFGAVAATGDTPGPSVAVIHWAPGSYANRVLDGSVECKVVNPPARYRMDGRFGVLASMRPEGDMTTPAVHEVLVGETGEMNVVDHLYLLQGAIRDLGTGTCSRAWTSMRLGNLGGNSLLRASTHDNLLREIAFATLTAGGPAGTAPWSLTGATVERARRPEAIALVKSGRRDGSLSQSVATWRAPRLPVGGDAHDIVAASERGTIHREGERGYTAAVRVSVPRDGRAGIRLAAGARTATTWRDGGATGFIGELYVRLRTAADAETIRLDLLVGRSDAEFSEPLLVEGTVVPTAPVVPLSSGGGRVRGELWWPGPIQNVTLALGVEVRLAVEAVVDSVATWFPGGQPPDDVRFELVRRFGEGAGDAEVVALTHAAEQATYRAALPRTSGRHGLECQPGDRLLLRHGAGPVVPGLLAGLMAVAVVRQPYLTPPLEVF